MTHVLFLMSDTGGGHRAACRAMEAALDIRYPGLFTYEMVDLWKDYTPFPFNKSPETYALWVNNSPGTYAAQFWVNDRLFRRRTISDMYGQVMFPRMKRMYAEHPADIIVCAHSVFVRPAIHALRRLNIARPFVTVITDYAWPVVLWYDARVDRCLVPTRPAYQRGLALGIPPEKMALTGAPVHPKFAELKMSKAEARAELGWNQEAKIILSIGGGAGMGPLVANAKAIDKLRLDCEQVVVAGRNEAMRAVLEAHKWQRPTRVYGFVNNVQVFMRAADLLITKAGPATITEAAIVGLPMVISDAIQYQESPNVDYVVQQGAGVYAPGPELVAESVAKLLAENGARLRELARGVKRLAQPDAIWRIADEIQAYAPLPVSRRSSSASSLH